jgi:hypothetical protein
MRQAAASQEDWIHDIALERKEELWLASQMPGYAR